MTPTDILYTPMLIAVLVKYWLVPLCKVTFPNRKWTPSSTKICVYTWSILLCALALWLGFLGPISPSALWVGLAASIMAGTGSIGLHETGKKDSDYKG